MTTDSAVTTATQVATPAQEPSNPVTEVNKDTEAPQEAVEAKEPTEAEKAQKAFEKRIARQTAANRESQRQLQEARAKLAEYEAKLAATKPLDDKPSPDNFEDHEAYTDALADWKLAQKEKAAAEKAKEPNVDEIVEQKLKQKEMEISFKAKEDEFRKATPDYDQATSVVNGLLAHVSPNHPSTQAFATELLNAPNPPALVHYLGTHPQEAIAMMRMSPAEIQDQMGVIIDKLTDAQTSTTAAVADGETIVPKAALPKPPSSLQGSTRVNKSPDQMTGRELLDKYMPKGR